MNNHMGSIPSMSGSNGKASFFYRPLFHILLIALTGMAVYSNTFNVPFQWDEQTYIRENPFIRDVSYFSNPAKAKGHEFYGALKNRYVGYLTFALEYKLHGFDVRGYHVFNLLVHIINSLLVYVLFLSVFRTPFLSGMGGHSRFMAFFAALLFVSHPVQTEAVTYIFQRLASLSAMFFLLSIVLYAKWRTAPAGIGRMPLYLLCLFSAALAMKTKENAFTLPVVIAAFEFLFFSGPLLRRTLALLPVLLTMLIIPLSVLSGGGDEPIFEAAKGLGSQGFSRQEYCLTQLRVFVTYIRLLFVPVGQNLDYDYRLYTSFFDKEVLFSFIFFLAVLGAAAALFCRFKFKNPLSRPIAFGIFWFFTTLSVESSIIPLPTLIDEYRLYLPSAGAFMAAIAGAFVLMERLGSDYLRRAMIAGAVVVPLLLSVSAYVRNSVWDSRISMWQDVVNKSPGKARAHNNLGLSYLETGRIEDAVAEFQKAVSLEPGYVEAYNNLGLSYSEKALYEDALKCFLTAVHLKPDFAEAYNNMGRAYEARGITDKALWSYESALRAKPLYAEAHNNMGLLYVSIGLMEKAVEHYENAAKIKPEDAEVRFNLGIAHLEMGRPDEARGHLEAALRLDPAHRKAKEFLDYIDGKRKAP